MSNATVSLDDRSAFRSRWPIIFLFILSVVMITYFLQLKGADTGAGSAYGIFHGVLGIVLMIYLSLYKARKSVYHLRLGTIQSWLQAHIYMGIISLVLVLMHSGFHFRINFSSFFLLLFILVVASGVVGSLIYKTIPLSVSKYGKEALTREKIIEDLNEFFIEAERSISQASEEFKNVYEKHIKPFFLSKKPKWEYLLMEEREIIIKRRELFESLKKEIPTQEIYDWNILSTILVNREKLAFKGAKLRILRAWLNFHMPLVFSMLTAALLHMLLMVYY